MRRSISIYALIVTVLVSFSTTARAGNELPDVFKNCSSVGSASTKVVGYKGCFSDSKVDYYGRVYLKFDPPETGDVFGMSKQEEKSFFELVKRFFLPKTKHGSIVLVD